MNNHFENSGDGDQNVAQGDRAIGKQENHYYNRPLKPRTVVLASGLVAGVLGAGIFGWYWLAPISPPVPVTNNISIRGDNNGTPIIAGRDVNMQGVAPEVFARYAGELSVTDAALASFFKILEEQQVPRSDLDSKLREIAAQYKELLARLGNVQSEDPEVQRLKEEARQTIEAGNYAKAEELLNRAEARDLKAIEELEQAAKQRRISAAATNVDQARLQEVQLRYADAVVYWQKAADLLPKEEKKNQAFYLHEAGYDLHRIARHEEALSLYKQSLAIRREIGDRSGEGESLNNISGIYWARDDYDTALKYLEQNLILFREIDDKEHEGGTLNNIGKIYQVRSDNAKALQYYERSLAIQQKIGDRYGEAITSWNIGRLYQQQGDLTKAEQYMAHTVEIEEVIDLPTLEESRKALADIRSKMKEQ